VRIRNNLKALNFNFNLACPSLPHFLLQTDFPRYLDRSPIPHTAFYQVL